jgi:hypothetical protein
VSGMYVYIGKKMLLISNIKFKIVYSGSEYPCEGSIVAQIALKGRVPIKRKRRNKKLCQI